MVKLAISSNFPSTSNEDSWLTTQLPWQRAKSQANKIAFPDAVYLHNKGLKVSSSN